MAFIQSPQQRSNKSSSVAKLESIPYARASTFRIDIPRLLYLGLVFTTAKQTANQWPYVRKMSPFSRNSSRPAWAC